MKMNASISLDLDNQWAYMKVHGDDGWDKYPTYFDKFIPHGLEMLNKHKLKITFFIVGRDAEAGKRERGAPAPDGHRPGPGPPPGGPFRLPSGGDVTDDRTVTRVEIAGDEYTIRSEASEAYTRECARYVNETIAQIMSQGRLVEAHKAAILAAMALADQLFQARESAETLRTALEEKTTALLAEIDAKAPASGLASGD